MILLETFTNSFKDIFLIFVGNLLGSKIRARFDEYCLSESTSQTCENDLYAKAGHSYMLVLMFGLQ